MFPNSSSTDDLVEPFRSNVKRFIRALQTAGASVYVDTTRRPKQRAFLMHWSFRVGQEGYDPEQVPMLTGVDIAWVHRRPDGTKNREASELAALQMVKAYGIIYRPAGRHGTVKARLST